MKEGKIPYSYLFYIIIDRENMKKKTIAGLIAIVAVVAVVMFVRCIEEKIPTSIPTETPRATPSPAITPVPTPEINEERELVKQWWQMYGEYDPELYEDDLDEFMDELKKWDIHPVEIYRGSMLFYEKSYGYIYIPDWDDDFRQMPYVWIEDWTDDDFVDLVRENGGITTVIFDTQWCACFPNLSDAENFLAEFWSLS